MFGKWFEKKSLPLTGASTVKRVKNYTAESGYVYQYTFEGSRLYAQGREFVFAISTDRKRWRALSVFVEERAVSRWQDVHGRELAGAEWYAIAKLGLFAAFDEHENPDTLVEARVQEVEAILETLGID